MEWFKSLLTEAFTTKLLGTLKLFIRWEFNWSENGLYIGQKKCFSKLLREQNMQHVKPADTPLPSKCDLTSMHKGDVKLKTEHHTWYLSFVGALFYLSICSRPDFFYALSVLVRQLHAPRQRHLLLAKRVARYVAETANRKIFYPCSHVNFATLTAYVHTDWAICHDTRSSTTENLLTIKSAPVYWTSKSRSHIALSSVEAEYVALSSCGKQVSAMCRLLMEVTLNQPTNVESASTMRPKILFSDSISAISLTSKPQNIRLQQTHPPKSIPHQGDARKEHCQTYTQQHTQNASGHYH